MYRFFEEKLRKWEENKQPEPMLIIGARQVGKTWLIQHFCEKTYEDYAYFNFENEPGLEAVFEGILDPKEILRKLSAIHSKPIHLKTENFPLIPLYEISNEPYTLFFTHQAEAPAKA